MAGPIPKMKTLSKPMFMVLNAIRLNGDVAKLTRSGLEYHQILQCIRSSTKSGLIEVGDNMVKLTGTGAAALARSRNQQGYGGPSTWIVPLDDATIEVLKPDSMYLPEPGWRPD